MRKKIASHWNRFKCFWEIGCFDADGGGQWFIQTSGWHLKAAPEHLGASHSLLSVRCGLGPALAGFRRRKQSRQRWRRKTFPDTYHMRWVWLMPDVWIFFPRLRELFGFMYRNGLSRCFLIVTAVEHQVNYLCSYLLIPSVMEHIKIWPWRWQHQTNWR